MNSNVLDTMHHVAIVVDDIDRSLGWYRSTFRTELIYADNSWAMLEFANIRLALVTASQHPPHIAIERHDAGDFGSLTRHRDGTESVYIKDSEGNSVELLSDPHQERSR